MWSVTECSDQISHVSLSGDPDLVKEAVSSYHSSRLSRAAFGAYRTVGVHFDGEPLCRLPFGISGRSVRMGTLLRGVENREDRPLFAARPHE